MCQQRGCSQVRLDFPSNLTSCDAGWIKEIEASLNACIEDNAVQLGEVCEKTSSVRLESREISDIKLIESSASRKDTNKEGRVYFTRLQSIEFCRQLFQLVAVTTSHNDFLSQRVEATSELLSNSRCSSNDKNRADVCAHVGNRRVSNCRE